MFSLDESLDNKPIFSLRKCDKTHLHGNVAFHNFLGEDPHVPNFNEKELRGRGDTERGADGMGLGRAWKLCPLPNKNPGSATAYC
jgi:hypothetical protein